MPYLMLMALAGIVGYGYLSKEPEVNYFIENQNNGIDEKLILSGVMATGTYLVAKKAGWI